MMSRMTEKQRVWEAWMDAFMRIHSALPAEVSVVCPTCGKGKVKVSYTGDPDTRIGYAIAWCDACLEGISLSRVRVPDGVDMLPFEAGAEERAAVVPPDVRLLPPDPWHGDEDDEAESG